MSRQKRSLITLSDTAARHIKELVENSKTPIEGIRVSLKAGGCADFKYQFDYVKEPNKGDEIVEHNNVKLFIDPSAIIHVIGSEMDFIEDKFSSKFVFTNPNKTGECGCGESFSTAIKKDE